MTSAGTVMPWNRHCSIVASSSRCGPASFALGLEGRHLEVSEAQLVRRVDPFARREIVEQDRPGPGPGWPSPATPVAGRGRAGGLEGASRDLDVLHGPGGEDPGAEAVRLARIG